MVVFNSVAFALLCCGSGKFPLPGERVASCQIAVATRSWPPGGAALAACAHDRHSEEPSPETAE